MACTVVIPCHNGVELTRACVQSLLEQQDGPPLTIVLVDNGSTDETASLHQFAPNVHVLRLEHNRGFAGGVNAGLRAARTDDVLVLNNDTLAAPNLLAELTKALHSDPRIGAAAPVSNRVKGDAYLEVGEIGRDRTQRHELQQELARHAPFLQDVDSLAGLCLLMRRRTLHEVGVFDERFGHGNFEDDDLCLRLRLHGLRLVLARRAFLHHEAHATFRSLGLDITEQIQQRRQQFVDKWRDHPAGAATIAAMHHDLGTAAGFAERARRHTPQWLDADWHLGRWHEAHGDARLAADHLHAFLQHCPEHTGARVLHSLALLRSGPQQVAQRALSQTLRRHRPTRELEHYLLRRLGELAYWRGDWRAAVTQFRAAVDASPDSANLQNWLGLSLLADEQLGDAEPCFARAIELGHALAHTNLGICHHRRGQHELAQQHFAAAVRDAPDDAIARANYEAFVAATEPAAPATC